MEKKYIITYTSVEEKSREFIWDASKADIAAEDMNAFNKLLQYCNGEGWPEYAEEDGRCVVEWGFKPCEEPERYKETAYRFPKVEGLFHREILKPIAMAIAEECATNRELYLVIMKSAFQFAGGKDSKRVQLELSFGDEKAALEKAFCYRNAVSFMEIEATVCPECAAEIIALLVEEFASVKVVNIKPYTEC